MRCPRCHHDQVFPGTECERCGVVFARFRQEAPEPERETASETAVEFTREAPSDTTAAEPMPFADPPKRSAGRRAAAIGFGLAALTQLLPFLQLLIQYMVVLVHELGHAAAGWLFGYPSIPAFDFMYGGGVTSHTDRSVLVVLGVLALAGYALWQLRSHRRPLIAGLVLLAMYLLLIMWGGDEPVIVAMGHGAELLFAGLFFYRALTGSGCHLEAERPLYAWLAWHIVWFDLLFAHGLATSPAERANYAAAKGGGHWMDFSRLANETLGIPLENLALAFAVLCIVPLPAAWWIAKQQERASGPALASRAVATSSHGAIQ
ncbi:MAG: hypothetical protein GY733_18035 [bacterium]|nr:hypothetical protein [bacterium]MCP5067932.1 hypothetical protein [bacterium]